MKWLGIKKVVNDTPIISKGKIQSDKKSWWWNKDFQPIIKKNSTQNFEKDKIALSEANKAASEAKSKVCDNSYYNLRMKNWEKNIYRFPRSREKRTKV